MLTRFLPRLYCTFKLHIVGRLIIIAFLFIDCPGEGRVAVGAGAIVCAGVRWKGDGGHERGRTDGRVGLILGEGTRLAG